MDKIITLGVERVHPGHWQPRDRDLITDESVAELAADIKKRGILNPLIAVGIDGDGPIEVELIAGERRWRAAKLAGVNVPVLLVQGSEEELHEMAIVDNLQRENLTPLEEARALQALQELHGYSQRQLASHLHKSQPWVQQRLALLGAAPRIQEMVNTRVFSLAHARALSGLPEAVQETAAEHLGQAADKGMALTSRQVQNVGQKIKQFLDAARFEGVEGELLDPDVRNALIAVRHLLQTLPKEMLSKAVQRLLGEKPNSDEYRLLSKKKLHFGGSAKAVARLLTDPEKWSGMWDKGTWWTKELATALGRTCQTCIFAGYDAPAFLRSWNPPCMRWAEPERTDITSCSKCLLPADVVAIIMDPYWVFDDCEEVKRFESSYSYYVEDVEACKQLVEQVARQEAQKEEQRQQSKEEQRYGRLSSFREACEAADGGPDQDTTCPLDTSHFQAQWCARCAFGVSGECEFIEAPIKGGYGRIRPALYALVQIEHEEDNDGKKVRAATRVVPRCELFRFAVAPSITPTGWITFAPERRERQRTAMRWLRLLAAEASDGWNTKSMGVWSVLRWLPYDRKRGECLNVGRMVKYLLNTWDDDWGDGRIATLLTAAASESDALRRRANGAAIRLYNVETCQDEEWVTIEWRHLSERNEPYWWPTKIAWPFVAEEGEAQ